MFIPTIKANPSDAMAASHILLLRGGFARQSASGVFMYLPLGVRVLEKIERLIDIEMQNIGGQKLRMPLLLSSELWRKTGRWDSTGDELIRLKDRRGSDYCLGPTHEEAFTDLVAHEISSYRSLPLLLYQMDRKYRDELRPRFGLLRSREFIMKDLYSFHSSRECAQETYHRVAGAYQRIFSALDTPFVQVEADTGNIGGSLSHEYQVPVRIFIDEHIYPKSYYTLHRLHFNISPTPQSHV
jgi:prolyl-tRNA synthetase